MSNDTKETKETTKEKTKNTVKKTKKNKKPSYCNPCEEDNCRNIQFRPELTEKCAYLHGHIAAYVE